MFHKKAKTFCLFCGSQFGDLTDLPEQIEAFAFGLSEKGYRVIFGGGQEGLMGRVYKGAARAKQHHITGVPFFSMLHELKDKAKFEKLLIAKTLGRRKDLFVKYADVFVIFPGADGTIDEYFHTTVLNAYGLIDTPVIIANINGYYDVMEQLTMWPVQHQFMKADMLKNIYSVASIEDILPCFEKRPKEASLFTKYQLLFQKNG